MKRNLYIPSFLVLALAGFTGCSSEPAGKGSKAGVAAPDKIEGKAQINLDETSANDAAMNAGGKTAYLWQGSRRYRLFFNTPFEVTGGKQYVVEGINAQRIIDELGDPDQGKNGYPLQSSCERVVRSAWGNGLAFDLIDGYSSALRARIKRFPARPVFLVMKIQPKEDGAAKDAEATEAEDLPEMTVPADKQKAQLIEGPTSLQAPLWEPEGGATKCKVIIGKDGKISSLETGAQLCEYVPWDKFKYQAPVRNGKPVKVNTEVEIKFEARK